MTIPKIILLTGLLAKLTLSATQAESVTLHVDQYVPISTNPNFFNADMVETSGITFSGTPNTYIYDSGSMFCMNPGLSSYSPGGDYTFNIIDVAASLHHLSLTAPEQSQANAYVHWMVDNFYDSWVVNPGAISNSLRQDRAQAFENVLREIMVDWSGTNSSLNGSGGNNVFAFLTMADYTVATDLLTAVVNSGVSSSYTSSNYFVDYYQYAANPASPGGGQAGQGQNMLMIASVPEPTSMVILLTVGLSLSAQRRRR